MQNTTSCVVVVDIELQQTQHLVFMIPDPWSLDRGSWFMVHDLLIPGSWSLDRGSWCMVHGSWFMVHGPDRTPHAPRTPFICCVSADG